MDERLCERLRVAATAMWYMMGMMGQADDREELKAALYDLYEKHGKSVDGLKQELLDLILRRRIRRLVLTHKDRLLRFGAELVFALCELQGIEIVIIHAGEQPGFEEELAQDVLEIITVFSARLYGARSRKHKKLLDTLTGPEIEEQAKQLSLV